MTLNEIELRRQKSISWSPATVAAVEDYRQTHGAKYGASFSRVAEMLVIRGLAQAGRSEKRAR